MAYDPVKAHEYYEQYRKKGLKKGRKKGKSKTTTGKKKGSKKAKTLSLLGVSAAGLNDEGRMQAALVREQYKSQMNAALAGAKTEEERQQVRLEYSRKAQQAINDLKGSAEYAKPKTGKGGKTEEQKAAEAEEKARAKEEKAREKEEKAAAKAAETAKKKQIKTLNSQVTELKKILKMKDLTPESREDFTKSLDKILKKLLKLKGVKIK